MFLSVCDYLSVRDVTVLMKADSEKLCSLHWAREGVLCVLCTVPLSSSMCEVQGQRGMWVTHVSGLHTNLYNLYSIILYLFLHLTTATMFLQHFTFHFF